MDTTLTKIGECINCNPSVKLDKGNIYPMIDIDKIIVGRKFVTNKEFVVFSNQGGARFENGDTLMARITPCLENGKIAKAQIEGKGIGSTELFVFRGIEGITDNDFVYYLFKQQYIRELSTNSMTGASGRQRADLKFIKRIKISLPTLPIQRKIASILSVYDSLIENNTKRICLLEQMAENLYKEWFVRFRFPGHENTEFVDGMPKGWIIRKVSSIVKRLPFNRIYKGYELQKDGKVIVIDQSTDECLGFHNNEPSHFADYYSPLILFGDHSCKFKLMTTNFSLGENVIPFTSNENINEYWLFYATHKLIQTEEYKRHWGHFSSMKIIVPNHKLQNLFATIVAKYEKEKNSLSAKSKILMKQRDLLLPRLISGKLEVKA